MRKTSWTLIGLLMILVTAPVNGQAGIDPQILAKAKAGDAKAELLVGTRYFSGNGVVQDRAEAVRWWRLAASQGFALAEGLLGAAYDRGEGVERDYEQAVAWFRKAAEQGDPFSENYLGTYYEQGRTVAQDYSQAAILYRKAADQDFGPAESNLAVAYLKGHGVPQDQTQAIVWFRKAADHDIIEAERTLGAMFWQGKGISQDYAQAAMWYRKAAEQGDAHSENQLGVLYCHGQGVAQDYAQAAIWFRKAAIQGNAVAEANLGDLYHLGQGVEKDDAEAIVWYQRAADQGVPYAKDMLPTEALSSTGVRDGSDTTSQSRKVLPAQAIARRASESTVLVVSTDRVGKSGFLGSGFAIGSNLILTNSHVFPAGRIGLVRQIGTGTPLPIEEVVARDKAADLVVLRVRNLNLPALPIHDEEPLIGDTVFTMGNPEGLEGTFSEGIVSALRDWRNVRLIQLTAPISHGSSGGPVFNIYGEVIGISTSIVASGQNLNFAVPASAIEALLEKTSSSR